MRANLQPGRGRHRRRYRHCSHPAGSHLQACVAGNAHPPTLRTWTCRSSTALLRRPSGSLLERRPPRPSNQFSGPRPPSVSCGAAQPGGRCPWKSGRPAAGAILASRVGGELAGGGRSVLDDGRRKLHLGIKADRPQGPGHSEVRQGCRLAAARSCAQRAAKYSTNPRPALWLVGDAGVYLMSNEFPRFRIQATCSKPVRGNSACA